MQTERILDLTERWFKWLGQQYHKDSDCHFYIEVDFAYGGKPKFSAHHYGYIAGDLDGPEEDNYEDAETDLLDLVENVIVAEREWSKDVLSGNDEWGEEQIERAKQFFKIFGDE